MYPVRSINVNLKYQISKDRFLFKIYKDKNIFKIYSMAERTELETLEWWISGLMLDLLFFLISRLINACSSLQIN